MCGQTSSSYFHFAVQAREMPPTAALMADDPVAMEIATDLIARFLHSIEVRSSSKPASLRGDGS